ncbi:DNA excision repair protein ERCC-6-like [Hippoglossus stenolepis]|uniref:DNA excision repair protein ERCC-6-like n=1 Tax=Hippoglossus stenolepis TaxID=195615 RepID=UPI00159C620C|nr:DNA excision repair protein ERCC-6-like [Hippoglossus stenolepis]
MEVCHQDGGVTEVSEQLEKSLSMDTDDKMEAYHRFIQDGKDVARQGNLHKALEFFKLAHNLHQNEKLERRIKKIEELVSENDSEEEDEEFVNVNNSGLMLFKELHDKLYDYQRSGLAFLYSLYRDGRKGGILADDMGLGKTIQVISFLSGMYDNELAKNTLLVMPTSLITNWTKEFAKWTPGMRVKDFHGTNKGERTRNLEKVQKRGGVIITTYTMLMNNWQQLSSYHGREFTWDYMILDEAHKIKTSTTKTAKSASAVPSKNRVLLTGTPVQNNLREMWALFDFACHGTLLGTSKTFKTEYENPITRAREKDATPGERALGSRMSENLMTIIQPYFLRRTKSEVQKNKMKSTHPKKEHSDNKDQSQVPIPPKDSGAVMPTLTRKNDLIVWTYLSAVQEDIYQQFISLDSIKELLLTTRSPLAELTILKKLCDHPRLLSAGAIAKLGLEDSAAENQQNNDTDTAAHGIANVPDDTLISESGKMVFLFALLEQLRQEGHRTLVFAHYRKVLDIMERILGNRGFKVLRLDGTILKLAERERRIGLFQTDERYSVFLLTTQVGGVGITLTAANRVVIYDPSWNPATDAQAVDRAYRIGQTENVVVYRLITCGTVEEKIYRRQVFKDSLIRQNTGDKKNPFRYFSKQELKELFTLVDPRSSSTQLQLQALHSRHRRTDPELDQHIANLHAMEMFGISDHDLMFSLELNHDEELEDQKEHHYIEGRVQKAHELMKAESELQMQLKDSMASSTEPAWLRPPVDISSRERSNKRMPRNPGPSPSYPLHDASLNGSLVVVESDQSGSSKENDEQNGINRVIDLTADDSLTEEQSVVDVHDEQNLDSPEQQSIKQDLAGEDTFPQEGIDGSLLMLESDDAAGDVADASVQEQMDQSETSSAAEGSPEYVTAVDEDKQLNGSSHSKYDSEMELSHHRITSLQSKRLSELQASNSSFRDDSPSRVSAGLESFEGNFNLQLEDSDMFSEDEVQEHQEAEEEAKKLLSQLLIDGSFDVNKSLSERQHSEALRQSLNNGHETEESMNDSVVVTRKRRAAVISDSSDDDDDDDEDERPLENSFQVVGASTPKSTPAGFPPLSSRRSIGGNASVASRRSLIQSIIEDVDNQDLADEEEDDYSSERNSDEAEEDDVIDSSHELQPEETTGETLSTEEEEESESADVISKSEGEMSSDPEESASEPELASTERMDQCTVDAGVTTNGTKDVIESESYDSLVNRGRECYSQGKSENALGFFLRAIDIRPGDPEIQLMTIRLYQQLSKRKRKRDLES